MSNSTDIGDILQGIPDVTKYVPGKVVRLYFAHPITTYNTALEKECEAFVRRYIGADIDLVNPNSEEHQKAYNSFNHWIELAETCSICVFLPFPDKRIGSGVAAEIATFIKRDGESAKVYEYDNIELALLARPPAYFANPRRILSVEETYEQLALYRG
jgi:hypothetical protein